MVEAHPRVVAYVKNQGLQFEVPYRDGGIQKKYLPDFIVQVDDGHGPMIRSTSSSRSRAIAGSTPRSRPRRWDAMWVPGVNALETYGRWAFAEFRDVYEIEKAFAKLVTMRSSRSGEMSERRPIFGRAGAMSIADVGLDALKRTTSRHGSRDNLDTISLAKRWSCTLELVNGTEVAR